MIVNDKKSIFFMTAFVIKTGFSCYNDPVYDKWGEIMAEQKSSNPVGRPRKYKTPEEFDAKVEEYYYDRIDKREPLLLTGLCLFMGFSSRQELYNYADYDGFSDSVKRARTMIEMGYEGRLHGNNSTGAIFALKCMGWEDKQVLDHVSSDGSMTPVKDVVVTVTADDIKSILGKK